MESTGGRTTTPAKQTDSSVGEIVEMQLDTEGHQPENGFVSPETTTPGILTRIDQSVLPFLGGFAKYQKQLILLTWIPALFIGAIQYSDNFLLDQPNSTCVQPMVNLTDHTAAPSALLDSPQNITVRPGHIYTNGTYGTNRDVNSMQCSCNEWNFTLHTGLVENVVTKWSLVCNSTWEVHIAKFALLVGSSFGYLVFGILDDWFGRHPMLIISVLSMLVFGLSVAFSVNVPMFSVLRFFEGFCLAGIILSLYLLRIELCLPQWRFFTTMVAWFLILAGQLLMPVVAYLCRDWQVLQVVIICPLLLMLSYIWIFPESLRWLLATQQYSRSNWIMENIAKKNNVNMELDPDNIFGELQRALHIKPKKKCILTMVGRRNLWKNIAVLCFNSLTGFGIHHCFVRSMMDPESEDSNMFHNFYANFYTKAGITVASCLALCPAVGMMGRRSGLLMFMIITALASLLQLGLLNLLGKYSEQLNIDNTSTLNKNLALAFSIIGMFSSYAVSYLSIFICAEITPTVIRGGGLGLVLASAGFGMLTGPIMDLHNQKGYFLHHIIFACCTLICIICILLLPETRNQPLPETLADGESFNRQTLLNPRKSGEQRFLLGHSKRSTDYTRVHDMPLQEAVTSVMSTMDSAASSASDFTVRSNGNMSAPTFIEVHPSKPEAEDTVGPSGSSLCPDPINDLGEDGIIHASKEHLLSSSPSQQAPCVTEPLLAEEHQKTDNDSVKSLTDSAKSPDPVAIDIQNVTPEFNQILLQDTQATSAESLTLSMHDNPPQSQTPSSKPVTDYNIFTEPPPSSSTNSYIPCQDELVDKTTPSPPTKHSPSPPDTPKSDSTSCINDTSSHPPSPSSPSAPPSSIPHPCTDSGHMSSLGSESPPVIDIVNTTAPIPTVLPVTDIVHTSTPESAAPTATDIIHPAQCSPSAVAIDSVQTLIDCTVSSPLDCGALSIMDSDSIENNTLNGVMSS